MFFVFFFNNLSHVFTNHSVAVTNIVITVTLVVLFSVMKSPIQIPWRDSDGGYFLQDDIQKYRDLMVEFKICF